MPTTPKYISPRDFGAQANGVTDDTEAWQRAVDAWAADGSDAILLLPEGKSRIEGTVEFTRVSGGRVVRGHGMGSTIIVTTTNEVTRDVFSVQSCFQLDFRDFAMFLSPRRSGICQGRLETGGYSGQNTFTNIEIRAVLGAYKYGWLWDGQAPFTDQNNDLNSLYDCIARGYSTAGYAILHSQAKHQRFINCKFSGEWSDEAQPERRDSLHCGVLMTRGSFRFLNGGGGANAGADFIVCAANDNIVIDGVDSENSNRFARIGGDLQGTAPGATAAPYPVSLVRNRYAGNKMAEDGIHVTVVQPGPVDISGNTWAGRGPATPAVYYAPLTGGSIRVSYNEWSTPETGQMDDPGRFLQLELGQPYDHHVECEGNVSRTASQTPAQYRQLPPNVDTPNFYQSGVYTTANTQPTAIRNFANPLPGCEITIVALDENTSVRHGLIQLSGSTDWHMPRGASLTLEAVSRWSAGVAFPPVWVEKSRMDPQAVPDFGDDDIRTLEYRLGGRGAVVRFWDRRFGVTASSGKVTSWSDARGVGDPLTQLDATKQFDYEAAAQRITVPGGTLHFMTAPVPDNPYDVWVPFWVVVFRNKTVDPSGSGTILLRTYNDGDVAHTLRTYNSASGGAAWYNWPFPAPSASVAGAGAPMPNGVDDGIVGGELPYSPTGANLTAASLSGFGGAFEPGSNLAGVPTPFDTVMVGTGYADGGDYVATAYELCAVLELSVIDMASLMPVIKAWAETYHFDEP